MKYTRDEIEKMGYRKIGVNTRGECYESIYDGKRVILKSDKDGKYDWIGNW